MPIFRTEVFISCKEVGVSSVKRWLKKPECTFHMGPPAHFFGKGHPLRTVNRKDIVRLEFFVNLTQSLRVRYCCVSWCNLQAWFLRKQKDRLPIVSGNLHYFPLECFERNPAHLPPMERFEHVGRRSECRIPGVGCSCSLSVQDFHGHEPECFTAVVSTKAKEKMLSWKIEYEDTDGKSNMQNSSS